MSHSAGEIASRTRHWLSLKDYTVCSWYVVSAQVEFFKDGMQKRILQASNQSTDRDTVAECLQQKMDVSALQ